ncbi:Acg family FMN-binding oxidoreductase [Amycolatopsis sp. PS_44_ISF1]|uniref:Acg family FMN-binding oxidoreductase n=1 Tax=Amycolatopsis sp. PS_44_ISF1 TaxID=2974917 RepID=UPI0028DD59F8|nr:nitroreductase [Amycolatopsis sp. PS_44_ISF1]MDT8913658.1 nitroreductase [Amycolatopsis sp. PS_44_ISF1]
MISSTAALTRADIGVLIRAVSRAPSVHNTQPWRLQFRRADIDLVERADVSLPRHDPDHRDRRLSCGAALAHLHLAVRVLGRAGTTSLGGDGKIAATVHTGPGPVPGPAELARYHAIGRRRSYRRRFTAQPLGHDDVAALLAAGGELGVPAVSPARVGELGTMLGFATRVLRDDPAYQRELASWTTSTTGRAAVGSGDGVPAAALGDGPPPEAGLVRRGTPVPDDAHLAQRLAAETVLVFCTEEDTWRAQLMAGAALERTWLEATVRGLSGSVLTQPLHLAGFRERLARRLDLPGLPQAIFRCGHPADAVPPSPRLPFPELLPGEIPEGWAPGS